MTKKTNKLPTPADVAAISWENAALIREVARRALQGYDSADKEHPWPEARDVVALFQLENTLRKEAIDVHPETAPPEGHDLAKKFAAALHQAYGAPETPES